jgi:hypothetical protein
MTMSLTLHRFLKSLSLLFYSELQVESVSQSLDVSHSESLTADAENDTDYNIYGYEIFWICSRV